MATKRVRLDDDDDNVQIIKNRGWIARKPERCGEGSRGNGSGLHGSVTEFEELARMLPKIEALLVEGTPKQIRAYSNILEENAFKDSVMAYTFGLCDKTGLHKPERNIWKDLEDNGKLPEIISWLHRYAIFAFWAHFLKDPYKGLKETE